MGFHSTPFDKLPHVSMALVFLPHGDDMPWWPARAVDPGKTTYLGGIWPSGGSGGPKVQLKIRRNSLKPPQNFPCTNQWDLRRCPHPSLAQENAWKRLQTIEKNHGYRTCSLISLGCYDVVTRLRCSFGNSGGLWLASLSSAGNTNHLQQTAALGQASIPPGWFFPIKN